MGCGASSKAKQEKYTEDAKAEPAPAAAPKAAAPAAAAPAAAAATNAEGAALDGSSSDPEEDQLAKNMGNLERLRRELLTATPERVQEINAEMKSRKTKCKELRAKGVIPSVGYVAFNQIDVMKVRKLSRKQLTRMVNSLLIVFKGQDCESMDEIMTVLDTDKSGDIDMDEWNKNLKKLPKLSAVLAQDVDPDWGTLLSYRTHEDQLAKNMANLERYRRELLTPGLAEDRKAEIEKEMRQRKDACKVFRAKGIVPSAGYVAFNQIDMMKTRRLSGKQLQRLVNSLCVVYKGCDMESMDDIMKRLDTDKSGDIDEKEWIQNLKKLPKLSAVLAKDVDPDWGTLLSYRTHEDQLAKNMANLERYRRELLTPDLTEDRKAWIEKEMRQRKDACKAYRAKGIVPSAGYVVFNQIDVCKTRRLERSQLERLIKGLGSVYKGMDIEDNDRIMSVLDTDKSGDIDEKEWIQNLKKLPKLNAALAKDVDPDWGTLRSYRTLEEQLAKLYANIARLEGAGDESKAAELASRREQAAKMRTKGVVPAPGICVFQQIDTDKSRTISNQELQDAVGKFTTPEQAATWFGKMENSGAEIDEATWTANLKKVPELLAALVADIDPDTGRCRSL